MVYTGHAIGQGWYIQVMQSIRCYDGIYRSYKVLDNGGILYTGHTTYLTMMAYTGHSKYWTIVMY